MNSDGQVQCVDAGEAQGVLVIVMEDEDVPAIGEQVLGHASAAISLRSPARRVRAAAKLAMPELFTKA